MNSTLEIKNDYKDLDSDNYSSSNYKLIVEDNIKKIIFYKCLS